MQSHVSLVSIHIYLTINTNLSKAKKWQWLYKDFVLAMIAPQPAKRIEAYRQYMAQEEDEKLLKIFRRSKLPSMLGATLFISDIRARFSKKRLDRQIPAAKSLAPDIEDITAQVCKIYKVDSRQLGYVRRGIKNELGDVAIYLIRILRGEPLTRIGSRFNLNIYSSVSSAVLRIKDKLGRDRKLAQRMKKNPRRHRERPNGDFLCIDLTVGCGRLTQESSSEVHHFCISR